MLCAKVALQVYTKKNNLIFLTLTYDSNLNKQIKECPNDLNRFITNCKKTYNLNSYVWTVELTKKGVPHYHILMDIPYTDIKLLNQSWNSASGNSSKNSVRLPVSKGVVNNPNEVINYMSKYISKGCKPVPIRPYGTSHNLSKYKTQLDSELSFELYNENKKYVIQNEHCTTHFPNFKDTYNNYVLFYQYTCTQHKNVEKRLQTIDLDYCPQIDTNKHKHDTKKRVNKI